MKKLKFSAIRQEWEHAIGWSLTMCPYIFKEDGRGWLLMLELWWIDVRIKYNWT